MHTNVYTQTHIHTHCGTNAYTITQTQMYTQCDNQTYPTRMYLLSGCQAGMRGLDCSIECEKGSYGINCLFQCNCSINEICDNKLGCIAKGTSSEYNI